MRAAACAIAVAAAGCVGHGAPGVADARITLYRDGAVVEERLRVPVDAAGVGEVELPLPPIEAGSLEVGGDGDRVIAWSYVRASRGDEVTVDAGATRGRRLATAADGTEVIATADALVLAAPAQVAAPAPRLEIRATPGARAVPVVVRYRTRALVWSASYTVVDDGDSRGRVTGALALDNRGGRPWPAATVAVVDRELPAQPAGAPRPERRLLRLAAPVAIAAGRQRVDLGLAPRRIDLGPTLVFDPVGDAIDYKNADPNKDPSFGVGPWPHDVEVSLAPDFARLSAAPLPAGAIRLFRVDARGGLGWLGEGRLEPPADDALRTPALGVGTSTEVTARRERTMFDIDYDRGRLVEEWRVTFTNQGDRPATVLAREHMYRGTNWTLVYASTADVAKAGEQAVDLRTRVPARGTASVTYLVSYHWSTGR